MQSTFGCINLIGRYINIILSLFIWAADMSAEHMPSLNSPKFSDNHNETAQRHRLLLLLLLFLFKFIQWSDKRNNKYSKVKPKINVRLHKESSTILFLAVIGFTQIYLIRIKNAAKLYAKYSRDQKYSNKNSSKSSTFWRFLDTFCLFWAGFSSDTSLCLTIFVFSFYIQKPYTYIDDCKKTLFRASVYKKIILSMRHYISIDDLFGPFILINLLFYTLHKSIGYEYLHWLLQRVGILGPLNQINERKKENENDSITFSRDMTRFWCVNSLSWLSVFTCNHFSFVVVCRSFYLLISQT